MVFEYAGEEEAESFKRQVESSQFVLAVTSGSVSILRQHKRELK